jgi:hypothetical protein
MKKAFIAIACLAIFFISCKPQQYIVVKEKCDVTSVAKVGNSWDMTVQPSGYYEPVDSGFANQQSVYLYKRVPARLSKKNTVVVKH